MKSVKAILNTTGIIPPQEVLTENHQTQMTIAPKCPICNDRGIVLSGDAAIRCSCMEQKKIENQFKNSRIGRNLLKCRFANFNHKYYQTGEPDHLKSAERALQAAKEFVQKRFEQTHGLGLLFTGPVGSGKTFLAAAIANELTEAGQQVLFLVVPDLLDDLRSTYDKRTEVTEQDLLDTARNIPVLILDDLGAHNYTEWTKNRIYSILNYRMNEQLPTVISTNLDFEEIDQYLGERTCSRLLQMCRVFKLSREEDIRIRIYYDREGLR